jgi:hypothetical protein
MRFGVHGYWLLLLGAACGSDTPARARIPEDDSFAYFTLRRAGKDTTISYASGSGLIFCREETAGANYLWIRLAAEAAANGSSGPHLDLDLCNFGGASSYSVPHDVRSRPLCGQGATWAMWWHGSPSVFHVSRPSSSPCEIAVTTSDRRLHGAFQCRGLTRDSGTDTVDVLSGSFRCRFP